MATTIVDPDFPNVFLPDGRKASTLRLSELWKELQQLKVRGINPSMGKYDLLVKYNDALTVRAQAIRSGRDHAALSMPAAMRQAAAELA